MYSYTIDKDLKLHLLKDKVEIDLIGAFDTKESAEYWGDNVCAKYNNNPTFVYPGEEPESTELLGGN
jgi:hypothetical protein